MTSFSVADPIGRGPNLAKAGARLVGSYDVPDIDSHAEASFTAARARCIGA